tara:strand:+ start:160 stop:576 length:417 start_codon:yes stop_codon:yes gene_type:complete
LLLSIGFHLSVSATNYVECEAIRAVIMRNKIQMDNAFDEIRNSFHQKKASEKYGVETCNLLNTGSISKSFLNPNAVHSDSYNKDPERRVNKCVEYRDTNLKIFESEWVGFYEESIKAFEDINKRAIKILKKEVATGFK